ncbi:ubiquitin carboxyl-terminal hydrolase 20-like [Littorina saxatilis]|uniref:ubiquitinyl hydrolase 1 n=1 Tax=Littorina saxatilis TaxID=31220 RepID=A0AAN9G4D5_9CAEN
MDSPEPVVRRPVVKSSCTHIRIVSPALCWEEIQRRRSDKPECDTCTIKGQNLWLCLAKGCSYVGCGINAKHHSLVHGKEFRHHLTINLTNLRLWCFQCEKEIFPGHNNPPFVIPDVIPASALPQMARRENSNNSTPQRSTSGAEESDSDLDDEGNRPRGLTGLQNLGNTCYLNSALQALSNCPPLTRFFLDCQGFVRPERNPMLSKSYTKLISELWHKKRLSYVVPSGIVSGIKAVHPMFRGYTQQDAQEFLRCFMDQLHEELKYPEVTSEDEEEEEEDSDDTSNDEHVESQPESGIASPTDPGCQSLVSSLGGGGDQVTKSIMRDRQNSIDSGSSQSELEYETCDSGLSSEQGSQVGQASSDETSDVNEQSACLPASETSSSVKTVKAASPNRFSPSQHRRQNKNRNSFTSAPSLPPGVRSGENNVDTVANLKEMKETANLLSKIERDNARNQGLPEDHLQKSESGEYLDALSDSAPAANTRSRTAAVVQQQQQQPQLQLDKPPLRNVPPIIHATAIRQGRKRKNIPHESVISHIFDGKILSSVQCLYCERVSTTRETFQDLSLPIPSKDYLQVLHSGHPSVTSGGGAMGSPRGGACGDQLGTQSWLGWMFSWMKSFFVGPTITLRDCLSAFFSADELKGDNMYSCEQCKKLRNGLKYSKVLELPEILCIHLKRFRHEFFSSKINTYISFPLHGLEMKPYLHKDCKSEITSYNLIAVVCHHGTAGGGHYTAYCLNHINEQWYEYDDQYVTEVDVGQVINCEAYVLFYRKNDDNMLNLRMKAMKLRESDEPSLLQFYVSKQWINRFNTFAEPGPISNRDFLCKHGGVPPHKLGHVDDLVEPVEQSVWELLYSKFGGGPVCNRLHPCQVCQEELDMMKARQKWEMDNFVALNEEFLSGDVHYPVINAMSMAWFKEWEAFVKGKTDIPPGPIDNSRIMVYRNGQYQLRPTADYGQLSPDMWNFLYNIYGGGPEAVIRQRALSSSQSSTTVSSSSPPSKDTTTTTTTTSSSSASPNTSSSLSPTPSPPLQSTAAAPAATATTTTSAGDPSSVPSAPSTQSDSPDVAAVKSETTQPTLNNSSSSSSASTITPSRSTGQVNGGEESQGEKPTPKPSAMSDSGDSVEEGGSRSRSQGSGSGVSTMQEVKGIPHPMDVTRL